ncbi:MAG: arylsulfatase [Pirellulales bacterium]|nr:arylsulfatase [Pirellulales bacterium]
MNSKLLVIFFCAAAISSADLPAATPDRPNIVIILADDMGYSDLGCYGGEIETPQLDALAADGLRFTQFCNTARCCPSRAAILTGVYPHQADVGFMVHDEHVPGYRGRLNPHTPTIAEVLGGPGGYETYQVGKWHVSPFDYATRKASDPASWPIHRGFQHVYGTLSGGGSYYDPIGLMRDDRFIKPERENYYYTEAISDEAVQYIRNRTADSRPLLMYVAYTAPHWPLHARPEGVAKYRDRYKKGWDQLREERFERMKALGIVNRNCRLSPRDRRVPAWKDTKHKDWEAERMAVYAAQVDALDRGVGRIVQALRETGQLENTLLFFLSDNGGSDECLGPKETKKRKTYYNYPVADLQAGNVPGLMPGPRNTFASYGVGWANLSNSPFRLYKKRIHEGGISTPLIVHWPQGIAARGELRRQPGHIIDLMATCLDVAGVDFPEQFAGADAIPPEGTSLRPAFADKPLPDRAIFWEHMGNQGVRQGDWKLVRLHNKPWELYNLQDDPTELHDLAETMPDRVDVMKAMYQSWAKRCHVLKSK